MKTCLGSRVILPIKMDQGGMIGNHSGCNACSGTVQFGQRLIELLPAAQHLRPAQGCERGQRWS
jgi:hypothetical protein